MKLSIFYFNLLIKIYNLDLLKGGFKTILEMSAFKTARTVRRCDYKFGLT